MKTTKYSFELTAQKFEEGRLASTHLLAWYQQRNNPHGFTEVFCWCKKLNKWFKHQRKKKLDSLTKLTLNGKRLYPSKSVKCLAIKIDENLNWKQHIHDIAMKLNRANALSFKIINYVDKHILRTIYLATFDTHINYGKIPKYCE